MGKRLQQQRPLSDGGGGACASSREGQRPKSGHSMDTHKNPVHVPSSAKEWTLFTYPFSTECHLTAGRVSRETLSETRQIENQRVPRREEGRVEYGGHAMTLRTLTYLVWRKGMGRDTHRKGSKVLLCFRQ